MQKQLSAYENDFSEETRATVQKLKIQLEDAQEELAETEWERQLSEQQKMLDNLYDEFEEALNMRLDNIDTLMEDMISTVNSNADSINDTLISVADDVGYTMTQNMQDIWNGSTDSLSGVVSQYGDGFNMHLTAIQAMLSTIQTNTAIMASLNDQSADKTISTTENETTPTAPPKPPATPASPPPASTTPPQKTITVGGKINAKGAKIYSYAGGKGSNQYFSSDPIYTVLEDNNGWLKVRYHKLTSGATGWFKKSDVKAYKTGGLVNYTGLAQVDGTPSKPELMLNANDTANFLELRDLLRVLSSQPLRAGNQGFGSPVLSGVSDVSRAMSKLRASNGGFGTTIGDVEINIPIERVLDYNDFVNQLKDDPQFDKMMRAMTVDRLVGGSSLAKNKYKW